jgi:hypothetical protein
MMFTSGTELKSGLLGAVTVSVGIQDWAGAPLARFQARVRIEIIETGGQQFQAGHAQVQTGTQQGQAAQAEAAQIQRQAEQVRDKRKIGSAEGGGLIEGIAAPVRLIGTAEPRTSEAGAARAAS